MVQVGSCIIRSRDQIEVKGPTFAGPFHGLKLFSSLVFLVFYRFSVFSFISYFISIPFFVIFLVLLPSSFFLLYFLYFLIREPFF